ncbi:MAG: hypothetical protein HGA65_19310 [Oscillochloris sp.]|nr:hypothetical protein [Oscillochloris sp.]
MSHDITPRQPTRRILDKDTLGIHQRSDIDAGQNKDARLIAKRREISLTKILGAGKTDIQPVTLCVKVQIRRTG